KILDRNPEEAAIRGKWGDVNFLKDDSLQNPQLHDTQFADYHGHGWNFRGVYARDRKGALLDKNRQIVADDDPDKWSKTVHLQLIRNPDGKKRFDWDNGKLIQRSAVTPGLEWNVALLKNDSLPGAPGYDAKAVRAHTVAMDDPDTQRFGADVPKEKRAHGEDK